LRRKVKSELQVGHCIQIYLNTPGPVSYYIHIVLYSYSDGRTGVVSYSYIFEYIHFFFPYRIFGQHYESWVALGTS
jgi:hypothetical protein